MERRRPGGGLVAVSAVALPVIVDLAGFVVPASVGYAMLAACGLAFLVGGWAMVAPDKWWFPKKRVVAPARSEPVLKGGFTLKPDTPLGDAIKFAATGNWSEDLGGMSPEAYLVALGRAVADFTQLAADDRVRVFYREYRDSPPKKLEPTAWHPYRIDVMDVLAGEAVLKRRKDDTRIETCHDLRVSREQWDANWNYLRGTLS